MPFRRLAVPPATHVLRRERPGFRGTEADRPHALLKGVRSSGRGRVRRVDTRAFAWEMRARHRGDVARASRMGLVRHPGEDRVDGASASGGPDHGRPSCDGPRRGRPCVRPTTAITCQRPGTRTACCAAIRRSSRSIRSRGAWRCRLAPLRLALSARRTVSPPPAALPSRAYDPRPMRSHPRSAILAGEAGRRPRSPFRATTGYPVNRAASLSNDLRDRSLVGPPCGGARPGGAEPLAPRARRSAREERHDPRHPSSPHPRRDSFGNEPPRRAGQTAVPAPREGLEHAGQVPSVAPRSECRRIAPPISGTSAVPRSVRTSTGVPRLWNLPSPGSPRRAPRCGRLGFRNGPKSKPLEPPVGRSARTTSPIHPFAN